MPFECQCLCGQVKVSLPELPKQVSVCHCNTCRKWGGSPLLALHTDCVITFEGRTNIQKYASSEWAERGFCKHCGTHLYYHLLLNDQYILPAGLFDAQIAFSSLDQQIFIDEKPSYYAFSAETECLTGAQVFAQFDDTSYPPDQ